MVAIEYWDEKEIINKPTFNPHVYLGKGRGKFVGCPPPLQSRANAFFPRLREPELGELWGEGSGPSRCAVQEAEKGKGGKFGVHRVERGG